MNPELQNPEAKKEIMKARELEDMRRFIERYGLASASAMTPIEHALIGGTYPGRAFHPNLPHAVLAGRSFEEVNKQRSKMEDDFVTLLDLEGEPQVTYNFLPLTEGVVKGEDYQPTIKLKKVYAGKGEESVTPEIEQAVAEKIKSEQVIARKKLEERSEE